MVPSGRLTTPSLPGTEELVAFPLAVAGSQKELQAPVQSTLPAAASWSDAYSAWPDESTSTVPALPRSFADTVPDPDPDIAVASPPPPPQAASVAAAAIEIPPIKSFFIV